MYAHPAQLADFVIAEWPVAVPLPLDRDTLVKLTSTCFQASLMHEEGRLARFRMLADLSMVDGAIVLNKRFELTGFGAEVSGQLPCPRIVWQALDVEAKRRAPA